MNEPSIYNWVIGEESSFQKDEIQVADNWHWNLRNHVQLIFQLRNGIFTTGENNWLRAFKNIMEPMLNLSYWAEDIEVKDVVFFIEEESGRALSFLIKKYHDEVFVRKHNLDTLFDEIAESDLDYGGVLVQKTDTPKPEVLPLQTLAFCDQTDMLGGPIAFKVSYAPDKIRGMSAYGWGNPKNGANITIDELITVAKQEKSFSGNVGLKNKTPGKNIEVYVIHGNMPEHYLYDDNNMEGYCNQLQIIAFYHGKNDNREGVTLYRQKEEEGVLKFHTSKKVHGRALGRGAGEALLHPQIWTNFLEIHKMNMQESASKIPLYTDDPTYTQKNNIQDMENLEVTVIEKGGEIRQVPTAAPANIQLMERSINEWYEQGQLAASAFDPLMGKEATSGTTFRGQERVVQQGKGLHERRRGQRAKFIEEIYRDWVIKEMVKEILKGQEFLATLSIEEMQYVVEQIVTNETNKRIKEMVLAGQTPTPDQVDLFKQLVQDEFRKNGNKHLLKILEEDFQGVEVRMGINIAGKQKDLVGISDKLLSVFQTIVANPYIIKAPPVLKLFNEIIEMSGLQPIDLSGLNVPPMPVRRMTETIDYKDLAIPPNDSQKQMLELAGIQANEQFASTTP